jgi:hypothetical protein
MIDLTFEPERHLYQWRGSYRRSVTQVIDLAGEATDYSGVPPALLREASYHGKLVHAIMAVKVQHAIDMTAGGVSWAPRWMQEAGSFTFGAPKVQGCVRAALSFLAAWSHLRLIEIETPMYSERFEFAGTRDLKAWNGTKRAIFDWKTTNPYYPEPTEIQLGGYAILEEERGERVDEAFGIELRRDGRAILHPVDLDQGRARFLYALERVRGIPESEWLQRVIPEAA